jgi:hypothetical protein
LEQLVSQPSFAGSTAVIRYRGASYTFAMTNCRFVGSAGLDEDWRSRRETQGENSLALSVGGTIVLPSNVLMPLANLLGEASLEAGLEAGLEDLTAAHIELDIDIGHTHMNAPESFVSYPLSSLPLFPTLHDMRDYTANEAVCAKSGFWFGGISTLAKVTEIRIFGVGVKRTVLICGTAADVTGEVAFALTFADLPFSIVVKIAGYANEFVGVTVAQRQTEITDYFASVYDADGFDATLEYVATHDSGMRYRFVPKS